MIVVVAYPMGRIGSSALMGLLAKGRVNVGEKEDLSSPSPMNPKGFFELKAQQIFLERVFEGFYPGIVNPPTIDKVTNIAKKYYFEYYQLIDDKFKSFPIAIKSQRFLTIPLLYQLRNEFEIKVIVLERFINEQVASTMRVWSKLKDPFKKSASGRFIADWIRRWISFSILIQESFPFDYLNVSFNRLMSNPVLVSNQITEFINISPINKNDILEWIDPSLVNRKSYI
jgi:hypothetical protein